MKTTKHSAALLAALVLALSLTACGQTAAKDDPMNPAIPVADGAEIGEGSKTFTTEVADQDGKAVTFTVHTDWAFYIDGEYAMTGVDATNITDGAQYAFRMEKAN